jgi:hypothetical protein
MTAGCDVTLAGGLWRDERVERWAGVRALDGEQERELLERLADALPAERVTGVLASAVMSIGAISPVTADDVRELSIGDRERLVLALRALSRGDELECVFDCGTDGCGEPLELSLRIGELIATDPAAEPAARQLTDTTADGRRFTVRAVTGRDHERAARRALHDPADAAAQLVAACVLSCDEAEPSPPFSTSDVGTMLAALDPVAELLLEGDCPACGQRVLAVLDPISHLWSEMKQRRAELEHDVHVLATHYHWSEREIVALDAARRRRYLALIDTGLGAS